MKLKTIRKKSAELKKKIQVIFFGIEDNLGVILCFFCKFKKI